MKVKRIKLLDIILIAIIVLMFFSGILKKYISNYFGYVDDIAVILLTIIFVFRMMMSNKKKINIYCLIIFFNCVLLIFVGLIGNSISNYQTSIIDIMSDILSWQKFFLIFFIMYTMLDEYYDIEYYYKILVKLSKIFIICGIIIYVLMLLGVLDISNSVRYGLSSFNLGGHPSYACAFFSLIVSILLCETKKNRLWILLGSVLVILTFRAKGMGFIAIIFLLKILSIKKVNIRNLLILALVAIFIFRDQIAYYFLDTNASRAVALLTSFKIANFFFPIGSGFATFGTVASVNSYSKAYEVYGLSNRWGFSRINGTFVGDGGWATIIGQFGYIGLMLCIMSLVCIYKIIKQDCKIMNKYMDVWAILIYCIISSTNEIFFNSDISVLFAIILAILLHKHKQEKLRSEQN